MENNNNYQNALDTMHKGLASAEQAHAYFANELAKAEKANAETPDNQLSLDSFKEGVAVAEREISELNGQITKIVKDNAVTAHGETRDSLQTKKTFWEEVIAIYEEIASKVPAFLFMLEWAKSMLKKIEGLIKLIS